LPNILGLAAGYDSTGLCLDGLFGLGFGFIEIGSVNPTINFNMQTKNSNKINIEKGVVEYNHDMENKGINVCKAAVTSFKQENN